MLQTEADVPRYLERRAFLSFPSDRVNPTGIVLELLFLGAVFDVFCVLCFVFYDAFRLERETDGDDFLCNRFFRLPGSDVIEDLTASKLRSGNCVQPMEFSFLGFEYRYRNCARVVFTFQVSFFFVSLCGFGRRLEGKSKPPFTG